MFLSSLYFQFSCWPFRMKLVRNYLVFLANRIIVLYEIFFMIKVEVEITGGATFAVFVVILEVIAYVWAQSSILQILRDIFQFKFCIAIRHAR